MDIKNLYENKRSGDDHQSHGQRFIVPLDVLPGKLATMNSSREKTFKVTGKIIKDEAGNKYFLIDRWKLL